MVKKAEENPIEETPTVEEVEQPKEGSTEEETAESLKTKLEQLGKDLEKAQKDAKAHQKSALESGKWHDRINNIETRIDTLAELLEESLTKKTEDYEEPPKTKSYKERVQERQSQSESSVNQEKQAEQKYMASEIAKLVEDAGLEPGDEKLTKAENLWYRGDLKGALSEVKKVVSSMSEEKKGVTEQDFEKWYQARRKQERIDAGELNAETGQPVGSGRFYTEKQIDDMSPEEYIKNKPEIDKALREGRIKK